MSSNETAPPFVAKDILYPLSDPWEAQSHIMVIEDQGSLRFWHVSDDVDISDQSPDPATVYVKPRRGSDEFGLFERVENIVTRQIDDASGDVPLNHLLDRIEAMPLDRALGERMLRALVSSGDLIVKMSGSAASKPKFRLSDLSRARENQRNHASSFAHELATQSEQLGRLLAHAPTVGSQREELLRTLIERHVPTRYHVATGFIEGSSRQIDILIYDQVEFAPLFRTGNLVVVPIEAVRGLIEVKSTLTSAELKDALAHLDEAINPYRRGPPVFRGIFAYQGAKAATLIEAVKHHHRDAPEHDEDYGGSLVGSIHDMVTAICVLRRTALFLDFGKAADNAKDSFFPAIYELRSEAGRDSQAALFFDSLLRYLRHPFTGSMTQRTLAQRFAIDTESEDAQRLYDSEKWGPYMIDQGVRRLEAGVQAYHHWLAGNQWIEPPHVEDDDPAWDAYRSPLGSDRPDDAD